MLEKQRKEPGEAVVSTVLFDNKIEVIYDRVGIAKVENLTDDDYYVRGCTALLDAVGSAVKKVENIQKRLPEELKAEKVFFVITTDGQENASQEYSYKMVKKMIEKHETGYVSEKRDIDEIIAYILFLKNHADIRKKLSLNCTNLIKAQFLWEENIHVLISSMETQPDEVPLVSYTKTKTEKV